MRPRSVPWILLHVLVMLLGARAAVGLLGGLLTSANEGASAYGVGSLMGQFVWAGAGVFAAYKFFGEYRGAQSTAALQSKPYVAAHPTGTPQHAAASPYHHRPAAPAGNGVTAYGGVMPPQSAPVAPSYQAPPHPQAYGTQHIQGYLPAPSPVQPEAAPRSAAPPPQR